LLSNVVLGFLGRKWDRRFDGDVQTTVKTDDRLPGTRIKHRMTRNWLTMYNKFGLILRVETVINRPKEFWVFRTRKHRDGTTSQGSFPMNKVVGSLIHYQEQALACNRRYLLEWIEVLPAWREVWSDAKMDVETCQKEREVIHIPFNAP
jgi:hypothetical protein